MRDEMSLRTEKKSSCLQVMHLRQYDTDALLSGAQHTADESGL